MNGWEHLNALGSQPGGDKLRTSITTENAFKEKKKKERV
jgi:hypothetical protein